MTDEATAETATKEEKELYSEHPTMARNHPFAFALCWLLILAGGIGAPVALWKLEEYTQTVAIAGGVVAGIAALVMLRWWFRTLATRLTITSYRTILRRGLLSKHINEVSHANIRNVQIEQNPLERIFSTGTVKISSAGQSNIEIEVVGMPHPEKIRELINNYRNS